MGWIATRILIDAGFEIWELITYLEVDSGLKRGLVAKVTQGLPLTPQLKRKIKKNKLD